MRAEQGGCRLLGGNVMVIYPLNSWRLKKRLLATTLPIEEHTLDGRGREVHEWQIAPGAVDRRSHAQYRKAGSMPAFRLYRTSAATRCSRRRPLPIELQRLLHARMHVVRADED